MNKIEKESLRPTPCQNQERRIDRGREAKKERQEDREGGRESRRDGKEEGGMERRIEHVLAPFSY